MNGWVPGPENYRDTIGEISISIAKAKRCLLTHVLPVVIIDVAMLNYTLTIVILVFGVDLKKDKRKLKVYYY